jgi:DNA-directed RNA polymerase subunit RPC12/RpoP
MSVSILHRGGITCMKVISQMSWKELKQIYNDSHGHADGRCIYKLFDVNGTLVQDNAYVQQGHFIGQIPIYVNDTLLYIEANQTIEQVLKDWTHKYNKTIYPTTVIKDVKNPKDIKLINKNTSILSIVNPRTGYAYISVSHTTQNIVITPYDINMITANNTVFANMEDIKLQVPHDCTILQVLNRFYTESRIQFQKYDALWYKNLALSNDVKISQLNLPDGAILKFKRLDPDIKHAMLICLRCGTDIGLFTIQNNSLECPNCKYNSSYKDRHDRKPRIYST